MSSASVIFPTSATPQEIVERALAASSSLACTVLVSCRSVTNLRWARTTLTTNGETVALSVTLLAFVDVDGGVGVGSLTVSAPSLESLPALVAAAERLAVQGGPAEDAQAIAEGIAASPDWSDGPVIATSSEFATLAPAIGAVFAAGRVDAIEHFGYAEHVVTTVYLGTSTGVRLRFSDPQSRLELTAKSHERSRSTWVGRCGSSFDAMDMASIDAELRQALAWQERRVDVEPGRHTAVLTPSAVADLMIELYWSSVGRDAADGQSVWSTVGGGTRVGDLVVDPRVTLRSDPLMSGFESSPFLMVGGSSGAASVFDNALPVGATNWIDNGVLGNLITTRHSAQETGLPFRPAADNLRLDVAGGHGDLADVIARTDDGLLVTCLWYNRVLDPQTLLLTGLTRDGVYRVQGGEVTGAVTNFRFNDSPVGVLTRIADSGSPTGALGREMADYFSRAVMPPLVVSDYNFSTVSVAS